MSGADEKQDRFDLVYERFAIELHAQVRRIVRDLDACEDIVQETFLRVWNKRGEWDEVRSFRNWLLRIATNLALNHLRSRNRSREVPLVELFDENDEGYSIGKLLADLVSPGPESQFVRASERELVRRFIAELPEEKRVVLELVVQDDLSIREASDLLEIPDGTVKSRLHYGRRRLTGRLREFLGPGE